MIPTIDNIEVTYIPQIILVRNDLSPQLVGELKEIPRVTLRHNGALLEVSVEVPHIKIHYSDGRIVQYLLQKM